MLEHRGVASSILVFVSAFLGALAAFRGLGFAFFDGAPSSAIALGSSLLFGLIAATAVPLLHRRYARPPAQEPLGRRTQTPTLTLVEGGLIEKPHEPTLPTIDELVRMLDDAVLLSQEAPALVNLQSVELTGLISEAIAEHGGNLPAEHQLTLVGQPPALSTPGDPAQLSRAVGILISNALYSGSRAVVRVDHGTTAVVVHVDDNGPGVPKSERAAVFERAYHMEILPSRRSNHCAELVIARQISRLHGGDITVSASPEGGARFTLRLPLLLENENALKAAC
jgi:hypothetical protein